MTLRSGTFLSRLLAACTVLCMVLMLHGGFAGLQSAILNIQHAASGDLQLADGGWVKACDGELDDCDGHVVAPHGDDGGPIHHHHASGETPSGAVADEAPLHVVIYATALDLWPGDVTRLAGRYVGAADQPPRLTVL